MPLDLSGLDAAVSKEVTSVDSVIALLKTIQSQLNDELAGDATAQKAVNDYMDALTASSGRIDEALKKNVKR